MSRVLFFCLISLSFAVTITEEMVIRSTNSYFPKILEQIKNLEAAKADIRSQLGTFDLKMKAKQNDRAKGYYDGVLNEVKLEQRLAPFSTSIYAGARRSDGDFPSYEGKMETLDKGENMIGVSLSLLRNRASDVDRLELNLSRISFDKEKNNLTQVRLDMLLAAVNTYWTWVAQGEVVKVYQNLLDISLKRDKGIRRRIKKGDLAKIYQYESRQYILKRQINLFNAQRDFLALSLELALFMRDEKGDPHKLNGSNLPKEDVIKNIRPRLDRPITKIIDISPKISNLALKMNELSLKEEFQRSQLLPQADFTVEYSHDDGQGPATLQEEETRVMIQFEFPLQNRKASGKLASVRAKKEALKKYRNLEVSRLENKHRVLLNNMKVLKEVSEMAEEAVKMAIKLQVGEAKKFNNGASDFFVVNLREQDTAKAKIENIKAKLKFHQTMTKYRSLVQDFPLKAE